ncbi:DUF1878 family protein [Brevibacillus formosus]|uniref:DUF1878 family protein n=1 Tax=Brevibacillus formosus TaxID=54913 RepID=UPI003F1AB2A6
MANETLEQKVERLEFYVHLLREFAVDPETFVLWDWIMAEGLTEKTAQQILNALRNHHRSLIKAEESAQNEPILDELLVDLRLIFSTDGRVASDEKLMQIVKRASKMPIFPHLKKYF